MRNIAKTTNPIEACPHRIVVDILWYLGDDVNHKPSES